MGVVVVIMGVWVGWVGDGGFLLGEGVFIDAYAFFMVGIGIL